MSTDYRTLNHSKFLLIYHIIFVVKYRKKLLKRYGDEIKQFVFEIAKKSELFGVMGIFVALLEMLLSKQ